MTIDSDLLRIVRQAELDYPIESKAEFVRLLAESAPEVTFRGTAYGSAAAAELIPDFFFPVSSEADLLEKGADLLAARGLAPLQSGGA